MYVSRLVCEESYDETKKIIIEQILNFSIKKIVFHLKNFILCRICNIPIFG